MIATVLFRHLTLVKSDISHYGAFAEEALVTQKGEQIKGGTIVRAFIDLIILALLVCGAGFGGYWYGMHERLAPVHDVPPGTAAALPPSVVTPPSGTSTATSTSSGPSSATNPTSTPAPVSSTARKGKRKYWVVSSGTDYTGYSIVVSVNGSAVDSFFGPGKSVDVTRFVKPGQENEVKFEEKALGEKYNKHPGDESAELKVRVVHGPQITEDFKPEDVLITVTRNASESESVDETKQFEAAAE